jgi:hypothetical protein
MKRAKLDDELDRFFSREFPRTHFLGQILKKHYGSETRKRMAQRRDGLIAQQERLAEKRERIIEFALDGTITKADRDRPLKSVDDSLDVNRKALSELVETPLPSYSEWRELLWPFRNFESLPPDEKRRLITSRFQEVRVKDFRVVSLYLLTGEIKSNPDSGRQPEADPSRCFSCGCFVSNPKALLAGRSYCEPCSDGIAYEEAQTSRARQGVPDPVFTGVPARNDSYQRLQPLWSSCFYTSTC